MTNAGVCVNGQAQLAFGFGVVLRRVLADISYKKCGLPRCNVGRKRLALGIAQRRGADADLVGFSGPAQPET